MDRFQETAKAYNKLAAAYQEKFMDFDLYNDTYDAFCGLIADNSTVFEIGCGPGNITRYLLSQRPDLKIDATDIAPNMVTLAQINNPTANCYQLDCRNLESVNSIYSAIVCGFCLPYLPKDEIMRLLSECHRLLDADGIVYLSTIEGVDSDSGYVWNSAKTDRIYMYYHSVDFINSGLEQHGFSNIIMYRKTYEVAGGKQSHLIFIARKSQ